MMSLFPLILIMTPDFRVKVAQLSFCFSGISFPLIIFASNLLVFLVKIELKKLNKALTYSWTTISSKST